MAHTLRVLLRSADSHVLDGALDRLSAAARAAGGTVAGITPLPISQQLQPGHGDPKLGVTPAKLQSVHRRRLDLIDPSPELIEALMRLTLPSGVSITLHDHKTSIPLPELQATL